LPLSLDADDFELPLSVCASPLAWLLDCAEDEALALSFELAFVSDAVALEPLVLLAPLVWLPPPLLAWLLAPVPPPTLPFPPPLLFPLPSPPPPICWSSFADGLSWRLETAEALVWSCALPCP